MNDIAIRAENLSKLYRIGQFVGYGTLREGLANAFSATLRYLRSSTGTRRDPQNSDSEYIWALKDVSFEVKQGEVVGIIGRNGAGKTTLLKVLCRITAPTEGDAEIHGRTGSLLEVGTGFHPELTGRENVYLNGAILGMKKKEIDRNFDDIVKFAEVEKFMDTPLKRYSTGMQVRLAFSVAAHLEPEILMVDEVLAVGDYGFQKKCLRKMHDVARGGRTILFVSHNLPSIVNLCPRTILLDSGKVVMDGDTSYVVQHYIATARGDSGEVIWPDPSQAPGNDVVRLHAVRVFQDGIDGPTSNVDISKEVVIEMSFWNLQEGALLYRAIILKDQMETVVFASNNHKSVSSTEDPWSGRPQPVGLFQSTCRIPGDFLNEGLYSITAIVGKGTSDTQVLEDQVLSFQVYDTGEMRKEFHGGWAGVVRPRLPWYTEHIEPAVGKIEHAK